jgi:leucyl aminopeptidase
VLRIRNGKTVEVTNTDAEGRLVLADALSLAVEEEPDRILEISTLTGPCVTALGDRVAGLFGDDEVVRDVQAAAEAGGELVWHLPIPDHIAANVRDDSRVADVLQHNWVRWGSASFAAAFLTQFTGDVPFAHLDVAGPAWNNGGPWGDVPAGATGFGVRTLVEAVGALAAS